MLSPKSLPNGQEQHEAFKSSVTRKTAVQYDYRYTNGELFSCIKPTLDSCRAARDAWLQKKEARA